MTDRSHVLCIMTESGRTDIHALGSQEDCCRLRDVFERRGIQCYIVALDYISSASNMIRTEIEGWTFYVTSICILTGSVSIREYGPPLFDTNSAHFYYGQDDQINDRRRYMHINTSGPRPDMDGAREYSQYILSEVKRLNRIPSYPTRVEDHEQAPLLVSDRRLLDGIMTPFEFFPEQ